MIREPELEIDDDTWRCAPPVFRSAGKITLPEIHGVLPFTGVRNPNTVSNSSHKISFLYKTEANGWRPKVGLADSGGELAAGEAALINPHIYDVEFQPVRFPYEYPTGTWHWHTIDLRLTFRSGRKRFVFVRNAESLEKPSVQAEIDAIKSAVPPQEAHEFVQVEADAFSRPCRHNLRRMHRLIAFEPPDPAADRIVEEAVNRLRTLWLMSDLQKHLDLSPARIFQSCLRLIAVGKLGADMDMEISHHARIWKVTS